MEQLNQTRTSTTATTRPAVEEGVMARAARLAAGDRVVSRAARLASGDHVLSEAATISRAAAPRSAPSDDPVLELDPVSFDVARRCALTAMKVHGVGPFARN